MQRYRFEFDPLGMCFCDIIRDDGGRYYHVEEVDAEIAALKEQIEILTTYWDYWVISHGTLKKKVWALIAGIKSIECWNENEHLIPLINALEQKEEI